MPEQLTEKLKIKIKETKVFTDEKLAIFSNSFECQSDDFFHQQMGVLFGVIQVLDHSQNSEYLPNLLTAVIKKSFYSHKHKDVGENFEYALKKANLALADLAEHDIVEWINHLHAIVGVIHGNKLYFTQVGQGVLLLGRRKNLTLLSEQIGSPSKHPIKTFNNILEGELKNNDLLLVSSPTIGKIFTLSDLKRLYKTFSVKEFVEIFRKTIEKEGENISTLIIGIRKERKKVPKKTGIKTADEIIASTNFLGGNIASPVPKKEKKESVSIVSDKSSGAVAGPQGKEEIPERPVSGSGFSSSEKKAATLSRAVDKDDKNKDKNKDKEVKLSTKKYSETTDTIHIKETKVEKIAKDSSSAQSPSQTNKSATSSPGKEKIKADFATKSPLEEAKEKTSKLKKKSKIKNLDVIKSKHPKKQDDFSPFEQNPEIFIREDDLEIKKRSKKLPLPQLKKFFQPTKNSIKEKGESYPLGKKQKINKKFLTNWKRNVSQRISQFSLRRSIKKVFAILTFSLSIPRKFTQWYRKNKRFPTPHLSSKQLVAFKNPNNLKKILTYKWHQLKLFLQNTRIKNITLSKLFNFLFLIFILVAIPLFFSKFFSSQSPSPEKIADSQKSPTQESTASGDYKNRPEMELFAELSAPVSLLFGNDKEMIIYTDSGELLESIGYQKNSQAIPSASEAVSSDLKGLAYSEPLNLFFLISDSQVISYSPVTKEFFRNKINLPKDFKLLAEGTYLDYLYLLNGQDGQIYRYPRATGGFGPAKPWLKNPLSNKGKITGMLVNENIKIIYDNGTIETYFQGKLSESTALNFKDVVYLPTDKKSENYFLFSNSAKKILELNKEDKIQKIYSAEFLKPIDDHHRTFLNSQSKILYLPEEKKVFRLDLKKLPNN